MENAKLRPSFQFYLIQQDHQKMLEQDFRTEILRRRKEWFWKWLL